MFYVLLCVMRREPNLLFVFVFLSATIRAIRAIRGSFLSTASNAKRKT